MKHSARLEGDATSNEGVAWSVARGGAYMPTPLVYGDELYVVRTNGVLYCYDAKTGETRYEIRLASGAGFTASPVAADGKVYLASETGDVHVVRGGPEFEEIALNSFDETTMASPAISEGRLFFRTRHRIVAVGSGE